MPFQIVRNDITKVKADAIVNTANPEPTYGMGTDSSVYHAAGVEELLAERRKIGTIKRGEAVSTPAFKLDAKYIIHTVGPVWEDGNSGEFDILRKCYSNSLKLAEKLGCGSVAFPLIAAGSYGFPKDKALNIAMSEISSFLMQSEADMEITMVVYDPKAFQLSRSLFMEIESFIDDEEVRAAHKRAYNLGARNKPRYRIGRATMADAAFEMAASASAMAPQPQKVPFKPTSKYIFRDRLYAYMQEKGFDNPAEVYKGAGVSRGAYSKIINGDTKTPKRDAVIAFCISMKLNRREAEDLMASAGWAFNPYDKRDQLIVSLLGTGKNLFDIDMALFAADFESVGSKEKG